MYLGKADVNTYDKGAGREFLISNGRGSYGFSTVIGANTRREHGLLVVRNGEEKQHSVLVSKIEETLFDRNKKYQLSTNRYKDLVYPDGYRYLQEYQGNPYPSMLFVIHSILLKKSIFMPRGNEQRRFQRIVRRRAQHQHQRQGPHEPRLRHGGHVVAQAALV